MRQDSAEDAIVKIGAAPSGAPSAMGDSSPVVPCSVGVMAHNEEGNIGLLLEAVVSQRTTRVRISEVLVVCSGCTDGTEGVVQAWQRQDARIRLLVQARREGKASAVNLFLAHARERVVVLCSADLLPARDTIEQVVLPLCDPDLGMTTCRPVPVNDPSSFMGFASHLLWDLHHEINLRGFKAGELIAFRKIFERIPYRTAVDEASIEPVIQAQGYRVRYVPDAIVYNKGPDTVKEFLTQRRRIFAGHLSIRDTLGYRVKTMSSLRALFLLVRHLSWRPRRFLWAWAVAALEAYGRVLGRRDYAAKREHFMWEMAKTTKQLEQPRSDGRTAEASR
jgi:poly-beta-1,6-N-acetyl-D-glucosamine synthase